MSAVENGKEHRQERAVSAYKEGERMRWKFTIYAMRVVKDGKHGTTQTLAKQINRSVDTVERFARAGRMYAVLRSQEVFGSNEHYHYLATARQVLSLKHFAVLGKFWENTTNSFYPMELVDLKDYLIKVVMESWSAGKLETTLREKYTREVPQWQAVARSMRNSLTGLINSLGVPEQIRWAAQMLQEFISEHRKKEVQDE